MFTINPTVLAVLAEQAPPTPHQVLDASQGQGSYVPFFCSRVPPRAGKQQLREGFSGSKGGPRQEHVGRAGTPVAGEKG